jgi:hypothetical protein
MAKQLTKKEVLLDSKQKLKQATGPAKLYWRGFIDALEKAKRPPLYEANDMWNQSALGRAYARGYFDGEIWMYPNQYVGYLNLDKPALELIEGDFLAALMEKHKLEDPQVAERWKCLRQQVGKLRRQTTHPLSLGFRLACEKIFYYGF